MEEIFSCEGDVLLTSSFVKMLFAVYLVFFGVNLSFGSELRCFECENCPGPLNQKETMTIKCDEKNVITTSTEAATTIEFETESYDINADSKEESDSAEVAPEDYYVHYKEDEMEFVCYSMEIEGKIKHFFTKIIFKLFFAFFTDESGTIITNRGCAIKLEQENETCALANYENTEYISCEICQEDICNGGIVLQPSLMSLFKALAPLFVLFLLIK